MQTPRELWTISEWFSNAGWGMYIIGVGAGVALPWNILSAFRPGPRSRRAAIVLTLLTVAGGIGMWFWGIHQMETAIVTLTPEQQQEVRVQGYLEARGLLEAVAVVAVLGLLAQILGLFTQLVLGRDERQFQRRGAPWHPLGFACYALAGFFLLPQAALMFGYSSGLAEKAAFNGFRMALVELVLGTGLVLIGAKLRGVKRQPVAGAPEHASPAAA